MRSDLRGERYVKHRGRKGLDIYSGESYTVFFVYRGKQLITAFESATDYVPCFTMFGEKFSRHLFIFGFRYSRNWRGKCQLFNFVLGQATMAVYLSRRNKIGE